MSIWAQIIILLAGYATFWFLTSILLKRNDIADIAWGLGFIAVAWFSFYEGPMSKVSLLVSILVTLWGLRLSTHIFLRNRGKKEDFRYKKWRDEWGKWFYLRSYLQVYLLQMGFLFLIATSFIKLSVQNNNQITPLVILGTLVWVVGFFFESVGDYQLEKFKKNKSNKGKIMRKGVWAYTRHPNYFGEVAQWWGIFIIALNNLANWWTLISPLTITLLILGVSGIPMLEKKYEGNKSYEKYKKETNAFFPGPKKQS